MVHHHLSKREPHKLRYATLAQSSGTHCSQWKNSSLPEAVWPIWTSNLGMEVQWRLKRSLPNLMRRCRGLYLDHKKSIWMECNSSPQQRWRGDLHCWGNNKQCDPSELQWSSLCAHTTLRNNFWGASGLGEHMAMGRNGVHRRSQLDSWVHFHGNFDCIHRWLVYQTVGAVNLLCVFHLGMYKRTWAHGRCLS